VGEDRTPTDARDRLNAPPPEPLAPPEPRAFTRLLGESALYALGSLVGKVVGVILLPIVSRRLAPESFGRLDLLSTLSSSASAVGLLGVDFAAVRLHPDLGEDARRRLSGSWLALALGTTVPLALGTIWGRRTISSLLFDTPDLGTSVGLVGVVVAATVLQLVGLTLLRSQGRPTTYAWITGSTLAVYGLLVVTFVALTPEVESVMWAYALSQSLGAVAALGASLTGHVGRPSANLTSRLLRLGLPALPAMAALVIGDVVQRTVLLSRAGSAEVGYLSVAVRFGSLMLLGAVGFQLGWQPAVFAAQGQAVRQRLREGEHMLSLLALLAITIATAAPEAVQVVTGAAYRPAVTPVGYMLVFGLLYGAFQVATITSALAHRPGDISVAALTGVAVGVVANLLAAERWGAAGTAAAIAGGQAVAVVVGSAFAARRAEARALRHLLWIIVPTSASVLAATVPAGGADPIVRGLLLVAGFLVVVMGEPSLIERARSLRVDRRGDRARR
jgi:O-antigen/teichoic acid export membrane protein